MLQHTLNNTEPVKLLGCDVDSQCAGEGFPARTAAVCRAASRSPVLSQKTDAVRAKLIPPAARLTTEPSAIS
ncbi:hypothetical protein DMI60_08370 [Escherichia coli]|nr:hypothetical protein [Escherichia coli]NYY75874.1 hypothetical protein [Escherichia coli]